VVRVPAAKNMISVQTAQGGASAQRRPTVVTANQQIARLASTTAGTATPIGTPPSRSGDRNSSRNAVSTVASTAMTTPAMRSVSSSARLGGAGGNSSAGAVADGASSVIAPPRC
jgi:hypothetical protein